MRTDLNSWQHTNGMSAVYFSPRRVLYQHLLGWILRLLVVQILLSTLLWMGLRATFFFIDTPGAANSSWARNGFWGIVQVARAELSTTGSVHEIRLLIIAQCAALVLLHLVFIPAMRRRLSEHVHGIKEVLNAIRELAEGSTPKPLAAGRKGEMRRWPPRMGEKVLI